MISKEERINLLAEMDRSSVFAAGMLFPNRFNRPFDKIHKQIFDIIDKRPGDPGYKPHKLIIAPRGVGKTSICGLLVPALAIVLQRYDYIIIIGYNADDAVEKTEELKKELMSNELIRTLYGDIKTPKWSTKEYVLQIGSKKIKIHPRGSGQPVRGRLFYGNRPGLILIDDLEKSKEVENPELRKEKKDWLHGDVLNCIDRGLRHIDGEDAPWEFLVMGTILHQDSLLINLHESDHWDSVVLEICDDYFESNAPNFMPNQACIDLYEQLKDDGQLDTWYREYRNQPVPSGKDAIFSESFYQYYDEGEAKLNRDFNVENVVIVDPSRTANMASAPTGIVGIGIDMKKNRLYVRECISKKVLPEEMYRLIAEVITRIGASVLAVEVTGLHEFITHPLKTFLSHRGIRVEFVELQARQGVNEKGKVARVRSLVDFYRQGIIYHNKQVCGPLEQQLRAFPKAKDWSLMDPFGYIVELLEKGQRYLSFPGKHDLETAKDIEKEYKELERFYEEEDSDYWAPLDNFRVL